ncbi:MAG: GNVR domain-containing protein, partial [Bacteroidota bacterium]|nr:GNVR domain-containing protein [Bacteroidota bacterium]
LTDSVVNDLTQYLVSYRVQKAQADYDFIKARQEEAERKYLSLQNRSAGFQDANRDVISAAVLSTGTKITNEYNLAFNLYNTLSQQLEQARLKVQQETPVFKVLNPAEVPLKKSKPKRSLILAAMIFLGLFVGVGIITGKMIYQNAKTKNEPQAA